mgnify:CR=1 FL=1
MLIQELKCCESSFLLQKVIKMLAIAAMVFAWQNIERVRKN